MNAPLTTENIHTAASTEKIRACYPLMCELRLYIADEQAFVAQVQRQMAQGYTLVYIQEEADIKALMGFRFQEFLGWGKVLYIDDLITHPNSRKKGYGSQLLLWAIDKAKLSGCDQVHLDSGPQRHDAHRLYLNHGFKIIAHHFALDFKEF